jgi:hypothetical protein
VSPRLALLASAALWLLVACASPEAEQTLPIANETDRPLRVSVIDTGRRAGAQPRRRSLELPAGQRLSLELRFGDGVSDRAARFEVRTPDGAHFHSRTLRLDDATALRRAGAQVAFGPADLGLLPSPAVLPAALQPIVPNLAAGKRALADEVDPAGTPERAIDGDPRTFWRAMNVPPQALASWAVDLGDPVTIERLQIDVECVSCGYVKVRLTFLSQPLPPASFAPPGVQQTVSMLDLVDRAAETVVGQVELAGVVRNRDMLVAAPRGGFANVRMVVATVLEGPENVGLYDVRLGGPGASSQ